MPRIVKAAVTQASVALPATEPLDHQRKAMVDKHVAMIEHAASQGVQVLCLQELFYGPYFCAEQDRRWYDFTEAVPDGPTTPGVPLASRIA